jgi:hypothetical protein
VAREPQTVLIAPPLPGTLSPLSALFYAGGEPVSRGLADAYRTIASSFNCLFLDAAQVAEAINVDGVHLDLGGSGQAGHGGEGSVEPLL